VGIDPSDRTVYEPGQIAQCDLWFPETPVPVTAGQARILPVLVVTLAFSRFHSATMIPSRQAGDILSGMWLLISQLGRVPKTLVWDRESAIGGTGKLTTPAAAFAGTLATDYYVRVDANDYSVDPRVIGRFVDVIASPTTVEAFCDGQLVARHDRSWARHMVITDPAHVATAHQMRLALAEQRRAQQQAQQQAQQGGGRRHSDGHRVALRALPDYDALFGVDFNPTTPTDPTYPTAAAAAEASNP
jgi:hypothetical protein